MPKKDLNEAIKEVSEIKETKEVKTYILLTNLRRNGKLYKMGETIEYFDRIDELVKNGTLKLN